MLKIQQVENIMQNRFTTFTVLIGKINRCIKKIKSTEMAEFDLKGVHVSCLYHIYTNKSLTAKELCDICDEDKASISRSIDYLEKNEFLLCNSTLKKRYKSALELTDKGKAVAEKIASIIESMLDRASTGMSEDERLVMYKSLNTVCDNLQDICDHYDTNI